MKLSHFAFLVALLVASASLGTTAVIESAPAPVFPLALVCIEAPGTSDARPCERWCERRLASNVLRYMRIEQGEVVSYEWRDVTCGDYLAERLDI